MAFISSLVNSKSKISILSFICSAFVAPGITIFPAWKRHLKIKWLENVNFLQLEYYKFGVAVPTNHRLTQKDKIDLSELSNEKIMIITDGDSKQNKDILNKIKNNCKNVEIKDAPFFYDINVFNTCEENGYLLITLDCWENVHPAFKTIPLSSGEKIAYGVIYSKEPST